MLINFKDMEMREVPGGGEVYAAGDEELAPFLPVIDNCRITEKGRTFKSRCQKNRAGRKRALGTYGDRGDIYN